MAPDLRVCLTRAETLPPYRRNWGRPLLEFSLRWTVSPSHVSPHSRNHGKAVRFRQNPRSEAVLMPYRNGKAGGKAVRQAHKYPQSRSNDMFQAVDPRTYEGRPHGSHDWYPVVGWVRSNIQCDGLIPVLLVDGVAEEFAEVVIDKEAGSQWLRVTAEVRLCAREA